jgi:16S rRNA (uracil1498-N3)-methyltransferase
VSERFYVEQPLSVGRVSLDGPEAHHLATVCRLRPGDAVTLFNGDGREYAARVVSAGKRVVELEIISEATPAREVGFRLEVAAPLPKGDRAAFLLEKLTELGATAFTPLRTARSVVHPHEAKLERLQRHVIEASKQCGRNVLLRVGPLTDWASFVGADLPARRLVAHTGGEALSAAGSPGDVALVVGPEGGLTDVEVEQARAAGWRVVGLGPRVLRVETAALTLTAWAALSAASEG